MKKTVVLKTLLVLNIFLGFSCDKNDAIEGTLPGTWIEVQPVYERTTLLFSSENKMVKIDGEGNEENFSYEIKGDSIHLIKTGQEDVRRFFFKKLDPARFQIGNFYTTNPEVEGAFMIFERQ
ncbi:hypothetical protein [Salinimicrobium sp. WS361]|uniref:hypothetical protein n=1 Tax=Salinimicrobium sp. WS361 TaxID=3425123 RepID=UPI003D6F68A4